MDILFRLLPPAALCAGLVLCLPVRAEVYRCLQDGVTVFTDRPCGAAPLVLPAPNVIAPEDGAAARAHEREVEAGRQARDRADAEWLEQHRERREREDRNRTARVAGTVVEGMGPGDVRAVLGSPDEVREGSAGERWIYRDGGDTRTVLFKDGAVVRITEQQRRRRK